LASIFLSWSSPDKQAVLPLRDRLKDLGLQLFEYSEDMPLGGQIHEQVLNAINQVQVAILCFSDATADRDWIRDEAAWCYQNYLDKTRSLKHIVPVWIAAHPQDRIPKLLEDNSFPVFDLAAGGGDALERFAAKLFELLGQDAPLTIPAALFSMTRKQCVKLFKAKTGYDALAKLCLSVGMPAPPSLFKALADRYGERPEDLAPFDPGKPLLASIDATLREANQWRVRARKRPLMLRWMQDDLVGPAKLQRARDLWTSRDSLLVVDSVSAFHPDIQLKLLEMPDLNRSALLWVPPYTLHLAVLESSLRTTAQVVARLGDAFTTWEKEPLRSIAFDTSTPVSLRLWLHRTLTGVADQEQALPEALAAMAEVRSVPVQLRDVLPRTGG
jgi:hypothetical protein